METLGKLNAELTCGHYRLLAEDGRPVASTIGGGHEKPFTAEEINDNARRLVACCNACEGIDNATLLRAGVVQRGEIGDVIRQRDDLLDLAYEMDAFSEAALSDAIEAGDKMDEEVWRVRLEHCRAAIARGTGAQSPEPLREPWEHLGEHEGRQVYVDSALYYKDDGKPADVLGCFCQMTADIRANLTWDKPAAAIARSTGAAS